MLKASMVSHVLLTTCAVIAVGLCNPAWAAPIDGFNPQTSGTSATQPSLVYDHDVGIGTLGARLDYIHTPKIATNQNISVVTAPAATNPSGETPFSYTPSSDVFNAKVGLTPTSDLGAVVHSTTVFDENTIFSAPLCKTLFV